MAGLARLKARYTLCTLSNGNLGLLTNMAKRAGLPWDCILSAEVFRAYKPDPATYIGRGKVEAIREIVQATGADTVICDGELAPSQLRNLEDRIKVKVVDRTALILDIFAQHARSQEGMVQVELAQLRYRLPRLRGRGNQLSQQGAGMAVESGIVLAEELAGAGSAEAGLLAYQERRFERCRDVIETSVAVGRLQLEHGPPQEHAKLLEGALARLNQPHIQVCLCTNQPYVGVGILPRRTLDRLHAPMLSGATRTALASAASIPAYSGEPGWR